MKILIAAASVLLPLSVLLINQVYQGNKLSTFSEILKTTHNLVDEGLTLAQGTSQKLYKKKEEGEEDTPPFIGYRLPTDIVPQHYNLRLLTDLEAGIFEGTVEIKVACVKATKVIRLHTKGLEIDVKKIRVNNLEIKNAKVPKEDSDNDFLVIQLKEHLPLREDHLVQIPFSGKLNADLTGYYLSNYTQVDAENKVVKKLLAVTRFEPTYARETFPCFDEPHMKASFTITLGHKKEYKAVTNMPLDQTTGPDEDDWVWDEFKTTAAISPHSVAFIVSELELTEFSGNRMVAGETPSSYQTWNRREMSQQLVYARENMPKLLELCVSFFGTRLPLGRMALVTAPNLSPEAKENWGLITLSEESVLIYSFQSSSDAKFQVLTVLAQELAQQWFGNMVTMEWWSDYWLIKGVTSYASSLIVDELNLNTHGFHEYNNGMTLLKVFSLDSFESSRPISAPIDNPRKINQISDDLTYYKGLLLIYMINSIVGPNEFRDGVGSFLKEFQFKAAGQDEFWKAVTTAANIQQILPPNVSMKDVVDSWTKQAGYPVITIKKVGSTVTVSQKRFLKKQTTSEDNEKACWFVPLTFTKNRRLNPISRPTPSMWLSCEKPEITFDTKLQITDLIVQSNKAPAIYRVNYDEQTWGEIAAMPYTNIHPVNRMQLISDAMEMAYVGQLSYKKAFAVLHTVKYEISLLLPWQAAMSSLEDLRNLLIRTDKYKSFKAMVQKLLEFMSNTYMYFTQYTNKGMLQSKIVSFTYSYACKYENNRCPIRAESMWKTLFDGPNRNWIQPEVRGTVYCEAVKKFGEAVWNDALKYFKENNIATEKGLFLEALACANDEALLKKFLELSLDKTSGIPKQDSWRVFWMTADYSKVGFEVALRFLQENLQAIYDYNKPNTAVLAKYFEVLAKKLVFKDEIDQMKQFATDHKNLLEDSWTGITQAMEQMDINLQWHETHYEKIEQSFLQ